ncbi:unnamed protein product [Calypogeia fissa]
MPVIPVRCPCRVCPEEWAMIELQGSIDIQQSALHQKLETLTIGSLCMHPGNKFIFNVGYHELEGSKVTLKKPLVIMKKKKVAENEMEVDLSESYGQGSSDVEMEVVGIIRHKLLFKNRPKALISRPEVKVKGKPSLGR